MKIRPFSHQLLVLLNALFLLVTAIPVMAHTGLKSSLPKADTTVSEVEELTLEFGAPIRLMKVSLTNASDQDIALRFERSATPQASFDIEVGDALPDSSYTVTWIGMGEDGHKMEGDFQFTVDPEAAPVSSATTSKDAESLFSGLDEPAAKAVYEFHQALSTGDAETVTRLLAEDVVVYESGGVERSREEYKNHHMTADMAFLKDLSVTILEHHVSVEGNSALSLARSSFKGQFKDKPVDHVGLETITLQKHDGEWQIKHIHWSN